MWTSGVFFVFVFVLSSSGDSDVQLRLRLYHQTASTFPWPKPFGSLFSSPEWYALQTSFIWLGAFNPVPAWAGLLVSDRLLLGTRKGLSTLKNVCNSWAIGGLYDTGTKVLGLLWGETLSVLCPTFLQVTSTFIFKMGCSPFFLVNCKAKQQKKKTSLNLQSTTLLIEVSCRFSHQIFKIPNSYQMHTSKM